MTTTLLTRGGSDEPALRWLRVWAGLSASVDYGPRAPGATAVRLDRVQAGDVIKASIKGRTGIWGEVIEIKDGVVYFRPLCPATGWRHTSARDVVGHWRKAGRRSAGVEDGPETPTVISKEQLSLPGTHT